MYCTPKVTKCCSYFYTYMNYRALVHYRFCVNDTLFYWDCSFTINLFKTITNIFTFSFFLSLMFLDKSKKVKFYIQQELKVKFEDLCNKNLK